MKRRGESRLDLFPHPDYWFAYGVNVRATPPPPLDGLDLARRSRFPSIPWHDVIIDDEQRSDKTDIRRTRFEMEHNLSPTTEFQAIGAALGCSDVYARRIYNQAIAKLIGLARRAE